MTKKNDELKYFYTISCCPYDFKNKNESVMYYTCNTLIKTQAMFEYGNIDETITPEIMELGIQTRGFCVIAEVNGKLYAFSNGVSLGGPPDPEYRPTLAIVANPALGISKTFTIGKDCVVIKNDPLYMGLLPTINRYSSLLTDSEITLRLANINGRTTQQVSASDDGVAESARKWFKDLEDGKIGVIGDKKLFDDNILRVQPTGGNLQMITPGIEYHQYLKASLENAVGIPSNYNMKREAINSSESSVNEQGLYPITDIMEQCRKKGVDAVNKMFGKNWTVQKNSTWEEIRLVDEDGVGTKEGNNATEESNTELSE